MTQGLDSFPGRMETVANGSGRGLDGSRQVDIEETAVDLTCRKRSTSKSVDSVETTGVSEGTDVEEIYVNLDPFEIQSAIQESEDKFDSNESIEEALTRGNVGKQGLVAMPLDEIDFSQVCVKSEPDSEGNEVVGTDALEGLNNWLDKAAVELVVRRRSDRRRRSVHAVNAENLTSKRFKEDVGQRCKLDGWAPKPEGIMFACGMCDFRTRWENSLRLHVAKHSAEEVTPAQGKTSTFTCDLCDYTTRRVNWLTRHKEAYHSDVASIREAGEARKRQKRSLARYVCDLCGFRTTWHGALATHKLAHDGVKPYACDECDYKSIHAGDVTRHKARHSAQKLYACSACEYRGARANDLRRHVASAHTTDRPFECDACDYRTICLSQLNRHKKIHSEVKPFECDLCDYKTVVMGSLKRHIANHHADGLPKRIHKCTVCEFESHRLTALKNHVKTHTHVKRFHTCDVCDYKTLNSCNLRRHRATHK